MYTCCRVVCRRVSAEPIVPPTRRRAWHPSELKVKFFVNDYTPLTFSTGWDWYHSYGFSTSLCIPGSSNLKVGSQFMRCPIVCLKYKYMSELKVVSLCDRYGFIYESLVTRRAKESSHSSADCTITDSTR